DDLRHVILTIFLPDVVDDAISVTVVEVDVDIGHRDAFPIEKTLEDQPMLDRVERGDTERVRDDAARRRTTSGTDGHTILSSEVDEVTDDQEVGRVAHRLDDADLHLETVAYNLAQFRIA